MCLVEYAPCQKLDGIGRKVKKADAKCGTIYEGMIYLVHFFDVFTWFYLVFVFEPLIKTACI